MNINIDFTKLNGLVPCVIQDDKTNRVLMLGFMNEEAYQKTISERKVTFFSRTKQRLWTKGETSGNFFELVDVLIDCDQDTLLIKVNPKGPACHTGADTCFNEKNNRWNLESLENLIKERNQNPKSGSYMYSLLVSDINNVAHIVCVDAV